MTDENPTSIPGGDGAPRQPLPRRRPFRLSPRWWLPLAFAVSLLLHLVIGIGGSRLLLMPSRQPASSDAGGGVDLVLSGRPSKKQSQPSQGNDDSGARAEPAATPPPAAPPAPDVEERPQPEVVRPRATPPPKATRPAPSREVATERPTEAPVVRTPVPTPTPLLVTQPTPPPAPVPARVPSPARTEGGKFVERLPVPLPKGDESGSPEVTARVIVPKEAAPNRARLSTSAEDSPGGGGSGTPAVGPKQTDGVAVGTGGGVTGGSGGGSGGGTGSGIGATAGSGAGAGNGLGISRGIPFGDRLGLDKGDPRGGGGFGGGPGGGGGFGGGGGGRFTLRRPSGGGGPPVSIVYVLDVSGSMEEGNKIGKARDALTKALDELRPEDSFNLISFSDEAVLHFKRMMPATNANISAGTLQVSLLEARGATNMSDALKLALTQQGVTHIFLLSDGEPTEKITDFRELLSFVREFNSQHARIVTLALGRGEKFKGVDLLRRMAQENDGRYDYIDLSR